MYHDYLLSDVRGPYPSHDRCKLVRERNPVDTSVKHLVEDGQLRAEGKARGHKKPEDVLNK